MTAITAYAMTDMERMARAFASSKLFGVQNIEQALALCLVAQAEGRHPASAAQDYHIINGRPAKKADSMLRDFLAGGGKVEWHALTDDIADATFSHPSGGSARIEWTLKRAKTAGLATPMWTKYPRQMLRSRVVSEGVRTVYPMATSGMFVPEEVQDFAEPTRGPLRDVTPRAETPRIEDASGEVSDFAKMALQMIDNLDTEEACGNWWRDNVATIRESSQSERDLIGGALKDRKAAIVRGHTSDGEVV